MVHKFLFLLIALVSVSVYSQERYKDSIFSKITSKTYTYAKKDSVTLELDFYASAEDTLRKKPLFVFVHGGGFSSGRKDYPEIISLAKQVASRGYAVASISYRLTRKGKNFGCDCPKSEKIETFKAAGEDVNDAVLYMLERPEEFKIDGDKVILTGSSAGAEAILNLAYNKGLLFKGAKYKSFHPAAVISLAGAILDKRYITPENAVPGIFFHGTEDPLVPYDIGAHHYCKEDRPGYIMLDGSAAIVAKLKEFNKSFLFYSIIGANHDVFKIPFKQLQEIFAFLNSVVIKKDFQQVSVSIRKAK